MLKQPDAKSPLVAEESTSRAARERELLVRIAASKIFQRAARLRDLLLDIGEHTISGGTGELSEHAIGIRVFGRREDYNSGDDNIVRASVRQLRIKLQEYFDTEGWNEQLLVLIPKGSYIAVFCPREMPAGHAAVEAESGHPPLTAPLKGLIAALACACLVLAIACIFLARENAVKSATATGASAEGRNLVAALLQKESGPVRFVITDSAMVLRNALVPGQESLEDYAVRGMTPDPDNLPQTAEGRQFWDTLKDRQITSLADVLVLSRLFQEIPSATRRIEVKHSKFMTARDFKSGNFILTGAPRANPWASIFEQGLNFRFDTSAVLRNTTPARGEPSLFEAHPADHIDCARIALLKNLSGTGFVLLLAGEYIEGTEGAGEFLLRDDSMPLILKTLGVKVGEPLPPFEIVLEITTLEGTARSARIVAWRRH